MGMIEPISSQLAYMVGIGNHEYDYYLQPFRPWWSNYMGALHLSLSIKVSAWLYTISFFSTLCHFSSYICY